MKKAAVRSSPTLVRPMTVKEKNGLEVQKASEVEKPDGRDASPFIIGVDLDFYR